MADKKRKSEMDKPVPAGGMTRSGGKLVPRFLRDMSDSEPIRPMKDKGAGLEVEPDKYAKGGEVRGYGAARKPGRGCKGA